MERSAIYEALGEKIRSERRRRGLKQGQLATLVGMSRSSITNVELGRQSLLVDQLYRIADALETKPEQLLPDFGRAQSSKAAPAVPPALSAWIRDLRTEG